MNLLPHERGAAPPVLPDGASAVDAPAWRLAFRIVDLGTRDWPTYTRITSWLVLVLGGIGALLWLAGPWMALGGAGAAGATKLIQRRRARTRPSTAVVPAPRAELPR